MKYTVKVDSDGTVRWYKEETDLLHREGAPAVQYIDGDSFYYKGGKLHRLDGPAIDLVDGSKEYWVEGRYYPEEEFTRLFLHANAPTLVLQD